MFVFLPEPPPRVIASEGIRREKTPNNVARLLRSLRLDNAITKLIILYNLDKTGELHQAIDPSVQIQNTTVL